jgi:hypothetical protein
VSGVIGSQLPRCRVALSITVKRPSGSIASVVLSRKPVGASPPVVPYPPAFVLNPR